MPQDTLHCWIPDSLLQQQAAIEFPFLPQLEHTASGPVGAWLAPLELEPDAALLALDHTQSQPMWISLGLLGVMALLAWVNVSSFKRIGQLLNAFVSNRFVEQIVRDEAVFTNRGAMGLNVVFLLVSSLFLYQCCNQFGWQPFGFEGIMLFALLLGGLLMWSFIKLFSVTISGSILAIEGETTEYLFNLVLFNQFLGLLLLPVVLAIAYIPANIDTTLIWIGGGIATLSFLVRNIKTIYLGTTTTSFSGFYIILYLCTLEILPVGVLIKALALQ